MTDDDEVVVEGESFDGKCPITSQLMVAPMKNDKCPHVFDKKGIDMLMAKKAVIKCPMAGAPSPRARARA